MFAHIEELAKYKIHIHRETKNRSFLDMSFLLQQKGIKNNKFMLALAQPELANIDPYNLTDPSQELVQMIMFECKLNPWYFLREIVRVQSQGGQNKPYILHRGNMAQAWCFYQDIDTYTMLPRQHYKTVSTACLIAQLVYFRTINFPMVMFTKDNGLVATNVKRLREIRNSLPLYLITKTANADKDNEAEIVYGKFNNTYKGFCAQNDPVAADKKARGESTAAQQYDEIDFIKYIEIMYPAALSATNEAKENARENGAPCANILTSTAGYLDEPEGKFADDLRQEAMLFTDNLYDIGSKELLQEAVAKNSRNKLMLIMYNFLQLGKTMKWLEDTVARERAPHDKVLRDYYNIPTNGSGETGLPSVYLTKLRENETDPIDFGGYEETTIDGYILKWYIPREYRESAAFRAKKYILGLDTSQATGGDFIAGVLTDPTDASVTMTFRTNETNLMRFTNFLIDFLFGNPNIVWIPENKSSGNSMLDAVLLECQKRSINAFKFIYNDIVQNIKDVKYRNIDIHSDDPSDSAMRKHFGYVTAGSGSNSRSRLFSDVLYTALEQNATRIRDVQLVNEFCGLKFKGGKLDHSATGHDDLVVAYLLTCYLIYRGKNTHIYGLSSDYMLSKIDRRGNQMDNKLKQNMATIQARIQELEHLITTTENTIIKESCSRELKALERIIESNDAYKHINKPQTMSEMQAKSSVSLGEATASVNRIRSGIGSNRFTSQPVSHGGFYYR